MKKLANAEPEGTPLEIFNAMVSTKKKTTFAEAKETLVALQKIAGHKELYSHVFEEEGGK